MGLPPAPPARQLRTAPAKPYISTESRVGNRVGAPTSTLIPHPTRRNPPSVSEFLGGQNFKEGAIG